MVRKIEEQTKRFDEQTMNETAEHYEQKMADIFLENERLKKQISTLEGKVRGFRRSIRKLRHELAEEKKREHKKPPYRNGKRGTRFNG